MISRYRRELRQHWDLFTQDHNAAKLLAFVRNNPTVTTDCGHEFPYLHRICDVILEGQAFRLSRCSTCEEELSLKPIPLEIAHSNDPGVPYWLRGQSLRDWALKTLDDAAREAAR